MKKVAIIDPLGAHGSSHHLYLFGQSIGLINAGMDVSLYTNIKTDDPKIAGLNFFSFYKDIFKSRFDIINGFRWIIGSIYSIFHAKHSQVSVFHFHLFHTNILVLFNLILVKLLFGRVVLTIHDVDSLSNTKNSALTSHFIYKLTDSILTHNEFSKLNFIESNPNVSAPVSVVPHGNYIPFINVRNDQKESRLYLGLPKDKTILLFFGMIKKVKGLDTLLHAFKSVVKENPDTVLLIAGKPWKNDFDMYQQIITKNNLSKNIILHTNFIAHKDVEHYYCASDLIVLPYKRIYQSGVLMMALSYQKAVLVSNLPPLKEIIVDNKNGFLFKSGDATSLSAKLNFILTNKKEIERVRKEGSLLISSKFSWDAIGVLTNQIYKNL